MRPRSIAIFERLLFLALAIDLVNNFASWSRFSRALIERGASPSPALIFFLCIASPLVGLAFWYFIARRRSVIAKWLLTLFVGASVVGFASTALRGVEQEALVLFAIAAVAQLLKVLAVSRLFTAEARAWLANRGSEAQAPT